MHRSFQDYEEFIREDLLEALYDKEALDEALEECRDTESKTQLLIGEDVFIITVEYATKSKEDNREIS